MEVYIHPMYKVSIQFKLRIDSFINLTNTSEINVEIRSMNVKIVATQSASISAFIPFLRISFFCLDRQHMLDHDTAFRLGCVAIHITTGKASVPSSSRFIINPSMIVITCILKCGMKLPIHSQTWTVQLLSFGMDKYFHATFCWASDYSSLQGLKLFHVSKTGHWQTKCLNCI